MSGRRGRTRFALLILLSIQLPGALTGCDFAWTQLRMLGTEHRPFSVAALSAIIEEQSWVRLTETEVAPGRYPLEALQSDEADLALVENSAAFTPGIRAVLPVFESVLHLAVRNDIDPAEMRKSDRVISFYVANRSAAGHTLVNLIAKRQGISSNRYTITDSFVEGETDLIVYFGPINPEDTGWMEPGFILMSLDNELNPTHKFYQAGISYNDPRLKPKTIPALTYALPGNEEALLSVAVDTLLVTRKEVPEPAIYELTRVFLEQKPRLVALDPHLFSGINASFDPLDLNFPLHKGSRAYLERDDPGFIERYAETISMVVYVIIVVISAFLAFSRWRDQQKKDQIDVFYEKVLAIRDGAADYPVPPGPRLAALDALEREAFDSLIKEKLAANESFRIFTDLLATTRAEIRDRAERAG